MCQPTPLTKNSFFWSCHHFDSSARHHFVNEVLVLDGKIAAQKIIQKLKQEVDVFPIKGLRVPGLAVIQVGENPASSAYIRQKKKAAEECGFHFEHLKISNTSSKSDVAKVIKNCAAQENLDGILLQLPLDSEPQMSAEDTSELLDLIPPGKDADGLHSFNQGKLFTGESTPDSWAYPIPATPLGIYRLLEHYGLDPSGTDITVVGKSRLVGLPTSVIMTHKQATVTICNRLTKNLKEKTAHADIVIVAAGKKHLISSEFLKPGAIVIDVGIHVQENGKLTGDVHPESHSKCKAYSPVPGGVGPMTVASLMENTFRLRVSKIA